MGANLIYNRDRG